NTKKAEIETIFFNRVAKAGSESMLELLKYLSKEHNFKMRRTTRNNFNDLGLTKPIYFNLVRDPVERVISWYFYVRSPWRAVGFFTQFPDSEIAPEEWWKKDYNNCVVENDPECTYEVDAIKDTAGDYRRQTLFFCGHNPELRDPIERVISWFYYVRSGYRNGIAFRLLPNLELPSEEWFKKDFNKCVINHDLECQWEPFIVQDFRGDYVRQSLFFCGHNIDCLHMNYIDFRRFNYSQPIYFNLVRDPVERIISWFYYLRSGYRNSVAFRLFPNLEIPKDEWFKKDFNKCVLNHDNECLWEPFVVTDFLVDYKRQTLFFCGQNIDFVNNTKKAEIETIFFNRVAKAGSESMLELLKYLSKENKFKMKSNPPRKTISRQMGREEQLEIANYIIDIGFGIYYDHIAWINFKELDLPKPIYFNLVRDPVERVISWYFYARSPWKAVGFFTQFPDSEIPPEEWWKKDFNKCVVEHDPECVYEVDAVKDTVGDHRRQTLFFCGHNPDCLPFNSPRAVQIAKQNVEKEFAVVGSWEDTNITLTVLEHYIPRYFRGATEIFYMHYDQITNRNKNKMKPEIYPEVKELIRKNFTQEIEFYEWCKQRLYKQYLALVVDKKIDFI
ncbi:uncharacterized protein LOC129615793, partial [Condylostylus longicornis]|uniref:uncharacterized protein LOC129615793 n=1 Tax=Condylostylus longicornis TaxID=2530218 RepID=UPI00244E26EC